MDTTTDNRLRTIVVEDERLPRLALLQKLENFSNDIQIIDSCDNFDAALHAILQSKPNLLFLDIQLQGRDAIQLLEEVRKVQPLPYVVFTTAYNDRHYLMSAIKLSAVDYLIKPVDTNDLAIAIAKAVKRHKSDSGTTETQAAPPRDRLTLKTISGMILLKESDILFVSAYGNYSKLTTFRETETVMESLGTMETLLSSSQFVRCDRSTIVSIKYVYKLDTKRNICIFRSDNGQTVQTELSKSGMERLRQFL